MGTGCIPSPGYWRNGTPYDFNDGKRCTVQIADGTSMVFTIHDKDCKLSIGNSQVLNNVCASVYVDINGFKKPNTVGKDGFRFWISKYGIMPAGTQDATSFTFETECKDPTQSGKGCAAWVLYNENIDYTKCSTLSWAGPTTCNP